MSQSVKGLLAVALLCFSAGLVQAADLNIGVVNISRLLDEAP